MIRRFLPLLLVALLVLGGLSLPARAESTPGGYVEQEIKLPDGYISATPPATAPDGTIVVAAARSDTRQWSLISWANADAEPVITPLTGQNLGYISSIDYASDGQLLAVCDMPDAPQTESPVAEGNGASQSSSSESSTTEQATSQSASSSSGDAKGGDAAVKMFSPSDIRTNLIWLSPDGAIVSNAQISGMVASARALSGRRTAVLEYGDGVIIYDEKGQSVLTISEDAAVGMAVGGDHVWLYKKGVMTEYSAGDGKELRSVQLSVDYGCPIAITPDGTVYVVSSTGIMKLSPDAEAFEKVTEATGFAFGDPTQIVGGICARNDGTLALLLGGGSGVHVTHGGGISVGTSASGESDASQLMAYVYKADLDLSNRTEFRVTALRASSKLRKAVSEFQRKHPELNVKLDAPLEENDTETPVEDAIRAMNTDLLAGKGGDVLVLDGLPLAKYIARGVLQDMTDLAGSLGVLPGILGASKTSDGRVYALPAQFAFTTLWGRAAQTEAITDLASINHLTLTSGQTPMYGRTPEDWLRLFYPASEHAFRDESGKLNFDTPAFAAFLTAIYDLYAAQAEQPEASKGGELDMEELQAMLNGSVALTSGEIASTMQASIYYTAAGEKDANPMLIPSLNGPGAAYRPSLLTGISAWTKQRELAEEFMKLVFSPELQQLEQSEGLPVVAQSLDKLIVDAKALSKNKDTSMAIVLDGGTPLTLVQPDDRCWDTLRSLCDQLSISVPIDETLMSFMVEETKAFFDGRASAEDAARAVETRATAYLNE